MSATIAVLLDTILVVIIVLFATMVVIFIILLSSLLLFSTFNLKPRWIQGTGRKVRRPCMAKH